MIVNKIRILIIAKMKKFHLVLIFAIIGCNLSDASPKVQNLSPCDFHDTVNITSGHLDQYGNFHHQGTVYKEGMFQEYDYVIVNQIQMVSVEKHYRGCICHIKPCIRLCCLAGEVNGTNCITTETLVVPTREEDEEIDLSGKDYGVLVGRPCARMYNLEPQDYPDDKWYFSVSS